MCDYSVVGLDPEDCNVGAFESCQRFRSFTDSTFSPPYSEDVWSAWLCDYMSDADPNKNAVPAKALTADVDKLLQVFSNNGSMPAPTPNGTNGQPVTLKVRAWMFLGEGMDQARVSRWVCSQGGALTLARCKLAPG